MQLPMEDQLQQLWQAVLGELELTLSKASFTTWMKNTFIVSNDDGRIIIGVPTTFAQAWLKSKYHQQIYKILQDKSADRIKSIDYRVQSLKNYQEQLAQIKKAASVTPSPSTGNGSHTVTYAQTFQPTMTMPSMAFSTTVTNAMMRPANNAQPTLTAGGLNPKYTFDNFIVGKANELAFAAAQAVAKSDLGKTYNPLFIYGGVGLGKTHLMQAIGNTIMAKDALKKVLYVTCEQFTNEFIAAIQANHPERHAAKYRGCDVLMVDDIQFLTGKEGTQEAFFHTFNELHRAEKQIVITSDRPPKAIATLEDRLLSRFEWGMIADISQPDIETRAAILEAKCREKGFPLEKEIVQYITMNIQNNIRELEGALNKIIAYYQLNNLQPNLENVKNILFSISNSSRRNDALTVKKLLDTISLFYEITQDDLLGKSREKRLAFPRQIIMFLMREEMRYSYPTIGAEIGGRDHTTAMHAYTKIQRSMEQDEKLRQEIAMIKQKLYTC